MSEVQPGGILGSRVAAQAITKICIFGAGNVVRTKYWPALRGLAPAVEGVMVCSLDPEAGLEGEYLYRPMDLGCVIPGIFMWEHGFIDRKDVLCVLAVPTPIRLELAGQLAGRCRLALEKPLSNDLAASERFLARWGRFRDVHCIDHKFFCSPVLEFLDRMRADRSILAAASRIESCLYETGGWSPGRAQEICLADVGWHLFAVLRALFKAGGPPPRMSLEEVLTSQHGRDPLGRF